MSFSAQPAIPASSVNNLDLETTETRPGISAVIGLLPIALQSRIAPFRRLHRSLSLGNLGMMEPLSTWSASSKSRPTSSGTTLVAEGDLFDRDMADDHTQSDVSACPSTLGASSAINWRYAHQGIGLTGIAVDASREGESEDFERKAYVDGVTYLLRGLPADLDEYETDLIRSALPSHLASREIVLSGSGTATPMARSGLPKSTLHRLVQVMALNLFLLVHFLLPYIVTLLKSAAKVERKYKISETIVGHGMDCFNAAGKYCGRVAEVVLSTSDGRPEQGVSGTFSWALEEVTRGISDGVGEGFVVTRSRDSEQR